MYSEIFESERFKQAMFLYSSALKSLNTKINIINDEFMFNNAANPIEHIKSRLKNPESIVGKLKRRGYKVTLDNALSYIDDIAGLRIICAFACDIYTVADIIKAQSDIKVIKIKDYIEKPKANGYRSYHMLVEVPVFMAEENYFVKAEIQIRTIAMDFWASLEHKLRYKFEHQVPENLNFELLECADIIWYLDEKMLSLNNEVEQFRCR